MYDNNQRNDGQQQEQQAQMQNNPFHSAANNALWSLQDRSAASHMTAPPNNAPTNIPQHLFSQPAIQPSSIINLSNSSDVVIGPMTQYQGPVTIYQYMDATVETRNTQARGGIDQSRNIHQTSFVQKLTNAKFLLLLLILVLVVAATVLGVELTRNRDRLLHEPIVFGNNYEHGTFPNLGNGHLIVDRVQWGASELAKKLTVPLKHPAPYVLITHIGVQSKPCTNIYKCSIKMRTIQDSAIAEKNLPDIQSNFYVADDGNVYVGRGWNWVNTYVNDTLAITFLGDYERYIPSEQQLEATQYLLAYALTNKYLDLGYKLVAQNQTKTTRSPGTNVIRQIRTWPHFYPCGMENNSRCGSEIGLPAIWDGKQ